MNNVRHVIKKTIKASLMALIITSSSVSMVACSQGNVDSGSGYEYGPYGIEPPSGNPNAKKKSTGSSQSSAQSPLMSAAGYALGYVIGKAIVDAITD